MIPTQVKTGTSTLTNNSVVIPQGARTIDLNNIGGADATILGQAGVGNLPANPVTLKAGVAYSFGDIGKPYGEITISAPATSVEMIVNY